MQASLARGWVGPACAVGAAVLYGTSWVATAIALNGFSPFALAGWRSLVTVIVLIPAIYWVSRRDRPADASHDRPDRRGWLLRLLILGLLGGAVFGIGMNVSIMLTGASITAFIAGAYPVIASAGAPLVLGESLRASAIAGLGLAFTGTLLIAGFDVAGVPIAGIAIAGTTAVGTGLFMLLSRRWQRRWGIRPTQITLSNFALLGLSGALLTLASTDSFVGPAAGTESWLAVLWLGIFAGAVATVLLAESHRLLPTQEGSAYLMLNPLTAAVLAVPVLGETLTPPQLLGAGLVLAGIALATGTFALMRRVVTRRSPAPSR